jgi:hypothetical protein
MGNERQDHLRSVASATKIRMGPGRASFSSPKASLHLILTNDWLAAMAEFGSIPTVCGVFLTRMRHFLPNLCALLLSGVSHSHKSLNQHAAP